MTHRTILTLGAVFVLARVGAAQERSLLDAGATRITLDDALTRAVALSPQLAQSEQSLVNAGESRRTAVGAFLPTISTNSGMSVRSTQRFDQATDRLVTGSSNSYNAGITARYDLFRGGQRFSEFDRAAADLAAARARREDQRFNVTFQTKNLFFQALRQEELLAVARRRIDQATQSLEMTRTQQLVGGGTVSDTLRARLEFINARQAVLNAEVQTRAARFALGRQAGVSEPVIPVAPDDLEPRPLLLSEAEVLEVAESLAPSVQGRRSGIRGSSRGVFLLQVRLHSLPELEQWLQLVEPGGVIFRGEYELEPELQPELSALQRLFQGSEHRPGGVLDPRGASPGRRRAAGLPPRDRRCPAGVGDRRAGH